MQRMKNWEVEMPHDAFMAEIRRMSSGLYAAGRVWSEALQDRTSRSDGEGKARAGRGGRTGKRSSWDAVPVSRTAIRHYGGTGGLAEGCRRSSSRLGS